MSRICVWCGGAGDVSFVVGEMGRWLLMSLLASGQADA